MDKQPAHARPNRAARVVFLDEDHVLALVRRGMAGPGAENDAAVQRFFAPEACDLDAFYALAHGLTAAEGIEVIEARGDGALTEAADMILFRRGRINAAMIAAAPRLRLVQRMGARSDMIDLAALRERGIPASCLARPSLAYTAEHAILLALALAKRLPDAERALRAGAYDADKVRSPDNVAYNWVGLPRVGGLFGATLGIVGLGEVGAIAARIAQGFGMRVIYANRGPMPAEREQELGVTFRPLDALMAEADVVTIHAPNTPATRHLVGAAQIAVMKPGAILVNTARGPIVDEDALYDALAAGRIAGAGLDVHRIEPRPADDRFCALPNVLLTPHLAGGSRLGLLREVAAIYDNMRDVLDGGVPAHDRVDGGREG
jgi:phosphoglycerate dehydrogenase-like enzyme